MTIPTDFNRSGRFYKFAKAVLMVYYRIFYRIRVRGTENIPADGAVVICANHTSMHDAPLLGAICPRQVHFIAKDSLFTKPLLRNVVDGFGALPMNREKPSMQSLKSALNILKEGRIMGIFLQGGRRESIEADDAKSGVALFAIKGKSNVVPVHIAPSKHFRLFSSVSVNIGAPISLEEHYSARVSSEGLEVIAKDIIARIAELGEDIA